MPQVHKRILGSRSYKDYTDDKLEECLRRIRSGDLSQRDAEKEYKIPHSTLKNKLAKLHGKSVGRPPVLTLEENLKLSRVQVLCNYGFPATTDDVCHYIQKMHMQPHL